jgi:tripartite-type tricarboxylate transporter receptor subunit TctC
LAGYEVSLWYGIGAPRDTPAAIDERLNQEINAGLADPGLRQRLFDMGGVPTPMTPAQFGTLMADETERWGKVIRSANLKTE